MNFIKKIFIGPNLENDNDSIVYKDDLKNKIKEVWNDTNSPSYGIRRVLRLFLILIHIFYPTVIINNLAANLSPIMQKLLLDFYVFSKFIWLVLVLSFGWYNNLFIVVFTAYLISETVLYILSMIVLPDYYKRSMIFSRLMIMLIFNYFQVSLAFSIIHLYGDFLNKSLTPITAIYFSIITMTTLGYGEFYPVTKAGYIIIIIQSIIFALFVMLFINYFSPETVESSNK
ncbi:MAG: ion channel [Bacillota bacterium]